jgi:hypothetical protein
MSARKNLARVVLPLLAIAAGLVGASSAEAAYGVTSLSSEALNAAGEVVTQAGAHPFELKTDINFTTKLEGEALEPTENLHSLRVDLATGFAGNPRAMPQCTDEDLDVGNCPVDTQIGTVATRQTVGSPQPFTVISPLYNMEPSPNETAEQGFTVGLFPVRSHVSIRTDGDYGISYELQNIPQPTAVVGTTVRLWGVPADPRHDAERSQLCFQAEPTQEPSCLEIGSGPGPVDVPPVPYFTNATRCGVPASTRARIDSWQNPGVYSSREISTPALTGCEELEFDPSLRARPTTNAADSPTGLDVDLKMAQNETPEGLGTAHLRDARVTLPEGLVVNPSSANGLAACSPVQIGLTTAVGDPNAHFSLAKPSCPDAASIGSAEIKVPAFADPLKGTVYLASPHENPFGSLLALYLVAEGHGLTIKLPGKVTADPQTGRLVSSFDENPQQPVEELKLNLFAGAVAPLRTPTSCGVYSTTSVLTPWSAPESGSPATPSDTYEITQGANGAPCGAEPNSPGFEAGSVAPLAGAYKPFVVNLHREDGTQQFASLSVTPPPGLVAKLAGTATCPDSALASAAAKSGTEEQSHPSCPAASEVGSVYAQVGAGPAPYNAPGKAYLTGPYKGAPLSLAIVTPAVAGPFDLGTIVVRTALDIDPKTAQVTAVSDPIPTILQGIPLDLRSVSIRLDKPGFTLNPTSCDPGSVGGTLLSTVGSSAALSSRFQLAECGQLKFKPSLALSLKGGSRRGSYPALTAVLKTRAGDANIGSTSVALPHSEFLAQSHIRQVCTRVQFAAGACPAGSIYGKVTVQTPLLESPLTGPVYLRSSDHELPDLVLDLHGPPSQPIHLEAAARIDSVKGGIRTNFESVPDVPFTKLTLRMKGGKKSLLVNSRNICARRNEADVSYTAHNGLAAAARPALAVKCGKTKRKHKTRKSHG